jgi:hypothetical protein
MELLREIQSAGWDKPERLIIKSKTGEVLADVVGKKGRVRTDLTPFKQQIEGGDILHHHTMGGEIKSIIDNAEHLNAELKRLQFPSEVDLKNQIQLGGATAPIPNPMGVTSINLPEWIQRLPENKRMVIAEDCVRIMRNELKPTNLEAIFRSMLDERLRSSKWGSLSNAEANIRRMTAPEREFFYRQAEIFNTEAINRVYNTAWKQIYDKYQIERVHVVDVDMATGRGRVIFPEAARIAQETREISPVQQIAEARARELGKPPVSRVKTVVETVEIPPDYAASLEAIRKMGPEFKELVMSGRYDTPEMPLSRILKEAEQARSGVWREMRMPERVREPAAMMGLDSEMQRILGIREEYPKTILREAKEVPIRAAVGRPAARVYPRARPVEVGAGELTRAAREADYIRTTRAERGRYPSARPAGQRLPTVAEIMGYPETVERAGYPRARGGYPPTREVEGYPPTRGEYPPTRQVKGYPKVIPDEYPPTRPVEYPKTEEYPITRPQVYPKTTPGEYPKTKEYPKTTPIKQVKYPVVRQIREIPRPFPLWPVIIPPTTPKKEKHEREVPYRRKPIPKSGHGYEEVGAGATIDEATAFILGFGPPPSAKPPKKPSGKPRR